MRPVIYPYDLASQGARNLVRALRHGAIRVRERGSYSPRGNDLIVNWGNPRVPGWWNRNARTNVLNQPEAVRNTINKIRTFQLLSKAGVPTPAFTTRISEARTFFKTPESKVLCRRTVSAHSGRGITIARNPNALVAAPLYVKYVPKEREYRIHVLDGRAIDYEQKLLRTGETPSDDERLVRSHRHGWIYARNGIVPPSHAALDASITAVRALGLDFGAVDLGVHSKFGVKVYEVNSAPGIEGTTVTRYATEINRLAGN